MHACERNCFAFSIGCFFVASLVGLSQKTGYSQLTAACVSMESTRSLRTLTDFHMLTEFEQKISLCSQTRRKIN